MAKFNTKANRPKATSPVATVAADARTGQGAVGWSREPKSELFLLGVANFVSEDTHYESALTRDQRFEDLITQVAATDPAWLAGFLPWLRHEANMRSAPVIGAAIAAKSMLGTGAPGGRQIIAKSLGRADEVGEFLSYWIGRWGAKLPKPVKRGLADAQARLYNERSLLKYDTRDKGVRFSNAIQLTHPRPRDVKQSATFKLAMDRAYGNTTETPGVLRTVATENELRKRIAEPGFAWEGFLTQADVSSHLKAAGFTWEDLIPRVPAQFKALAWQALIPTMGYMALLRNLRNFDEAGLPRNVVRQIQDRLENADQVHASKQFPFRFLSAYRAVQSQNWGLSLETALDHSLVNVPEFKGSTLVLVDRSGSMFDAMSRDSTVTRAEQAAIFGVAVALRNIGRVNLVEFGTTSREIAVGPGYSMLRLAAQKFSNLGGTYLAKAAQMHYKGQDRVIVITDEQYHDGAAGTVVPANIPVYTFNLAGYKAAGSMSGTDLRFTFGGLTDAAFRLIPLLEAAQSQQWPWESGR